MKHTQPSLPIYWKENQLHQEKHIAIEKRKISQDYSTPVHAHDYFEMEFILSGHGTHYFNGTPHRLVPGSIYLLTPADVHTIEAEEPMQYYNISFSEQLLQGSLLSEPLLRSSGTHVQLTTEEQQRFLVLFAQLTEEFSNLQPLASVYMQSLLQCILIPLLRKSTADFLPKKDGSNIPDAMLYLHRHFREPIALEDVAASVGLSPHYFCEVFFHTTGKHFTEYLNSLRIRYAYNLLIAGNLSITQVCYTSGFGSYASFFRIFRDHFHLTPMQLRKSVKK